jgi:hypothetical protein
MRYAPYELPKFMKPSNEIVLSFYTIYMKEVGKWKLHPTVLLILYINSLKSTRHLARLNEQTFK